MSGLARNRILLGDIRERLAHLPDGSIDCVITSPPYFQLRDYGIGGQLGLETTVDGWVDELRLALNGLARGLKPTGSLWLNLGDSYTSGNRKWRDADDKNPARAMSYRPPTPKGLKPKDLIGVPWRVAFALQDDGWYLRSDIIWNKPNCQPESVRDRPTRSHEYVFMFSKSKDYFYDREAVMEPTCSNGGRRNLRTVWSINTEAFPEAHFATFPATLVTPCVRAGSRPGDAVLDPFFGSGTVGLVCLELKRTVIGLELNEEYAKIARRRMGEDLALWHMAGRSVDVQEFLARHL